MQKIISLFKRNYETDHLVRDEVVPGAEWVIAGEGIPTRKWDGVPVLVQDGKLYKRYDVKSGKQAPEGSIKITEHPDSNTGHWPWWAPVGEGNEDKLFREGLDWAKRFLVSPLKDGTYELLGPKVNGNKEKFSEWHRLMPHGNSFYADCPVPGAPRTFSELKEWFADKDIEGIVWHHPDGRMVKIKKKDFGYRR